MLLSSVLLHTLGVVSLLYGVYTGTLMEKYVWLAAASIGFAGGQLEITVAYQLIYRERSRWMQNLGFWNLSLVDYSHFSTEHRLMYYL